MPHLVILYTPNLEPDADIGRLCRALADAMLTIRDEAGKQVFPTAGTRVLAYPAAHYAVADGIPTVNVTIMAKLTTGRGRKIVASKLFTQTGTASVNSKVAVVQALSQALGAAVMQIVDWTLTSAPPVEVSAGSPTKPAQELLHETARSTGPKPR